MKIAVAGPGELAHYFLEELPKQHDVVILTRSAKDWVSAMGIEQRITDYSVPSLVKLITDCDALISTVCLYDMDNVTIHLNIIEACKQSPKCKKVIPSEWGANIEEFPDQPAFYYENHEPIRQALRDQKELQWTLVVNGWFLEYVVPLSCRYFKSAGEIWPMDEETKTMTIYGKGTHAVDMTSARDVAKAISELVKHETWEPYTYIAGIRTSWQGLYETLKTRDPAWKTKPLSLVQSIQKVIANESEWTVLVGWFEVYSHSEATASPAEKIQAHKDKYFKAIRFKGINDLMDAAAANPDIII